MRPRLLISRKLVAGLGNFLSPVVLAAVEWARMKPERTQSLLRHPAFVAVLGVADLGKGDA